MTSLKSVITPKQYVGICRGALGELFQGPSMHTAGEIVIVSSLIPQYSWAYFTPKKFVAPALEQYRDTLLNSPNHYKAFSALNRYCQLHQLRWPEGRWEFNSQLQVARGMASSTADIVAVLRCAANYYNKTLLQREIITILSQIERSDSVFLNSLALFCSSNHQVVEIFQKIPPLYALYMHEKDTIDTDNTKELLLNYYHRHAKIYQRLYNQLVNFFQIKNTYEICKLSTYSAELSQEILPKKNFSNIYQRMKEFNADGIIVAHTGSVIGYLFCQRPNIQCLEAVSLFF